MIVIRSVAIQRISYRFLANSVNRSDYQPKPCSTVRLNSSLTTMPPPVLLAARQQSEASPLNAADMAAGTGSSYGQIDRGERRDSEMLEADDWADTFVDSTPKYDPTTYHKRELAHRLANSSHYLTSTNLLPLSVCLSVCCALSVRPWPG